MRRITLALVFVLFAANAIAQTMNFINGPQTVGSGLQSGIRYLQLSDSQHGGIYVSVTSNDSNLVLIAADEVSIGSPVLTRFVPNGTINLEFVVQGLENVTGLLTLTGSASGFTDAQVPVEVDEPRFEIFSLAASVNMPDPDDEFIVRVGRPYGPGYWNSDERMRVGGPGVVATFTNSDPLVAELVTSNQTGQTINLTLFGGQKTSGPTVTTGGVALRQLAPGNTSVSVNMPGFAAADSNNINVTINPAEVLISGLPTVVGGGLQTGLIGVGLNGTDHGGTWIQVSSLDPAVAVVSDGYGLPGQESINLHIPDGEAWAVFYIYGVGGSQGIVSIVASAPGFISATDGVDVIAPSMDIQGLANSIDTLDANDPFIVRVGIPSEDGTSLAYSQPVQPDSGWLDVAIISDNPAVGLLETSGATGDTVWVSIPPLSGSTFATVATGGVAFDGVGVGSTVVHTEIAGFQTIPAAFVTVNVTQPAITLLDPNGAGVGAGMQIPIYLRLDSSEHGGVIIHIEVDDPAMALISDMPDLIGSSGIDIEIADGNNFVELFFQGLEGVSGPVQVSATGPGFQSAMQNVDVLTPALRIKALNQYNSTLDPTQSTIASLDLFVVQIGVPVGNIYLSPQLLRPGSPGMDVTAAVDDPLLGEFVTAENSAPMVSVRIEAGQSETGATLEDGAVGFDALNAGDVLVSVSSPGFIQQDTANQLVNVIPAAISTYPFDDVGAGLATSLTRYVELNGAGHGGVTVHFDVTNPDLALLSANNFDLGQSAMEVYVPDGDTRAYYNIHGMEDVVGTATVIVTAPELMTDQGPVTAQFDTEVVQSAVEIINLMAALDVSNADNVFQVRVGLPSANNANVWIPQVRRPGVSPLTATVTSSNPAVASIISLAGPSASHEVYLNPSHDTSPVTLVNGGLALRGESVGSVLVSVDLPGFMPMGSATQEVFITQDGIALPGVPAALGAGLQTGPLLARLSNGEHDGTTIKVTTNIPGSILVSSHAQISGVDTLSMHIPAGQLDTVFHLQALEEALGTITVQALIGNEIFGIRNMEIVQPAIAITQLADSLNVIDGMDAFVLEVGVPTADLTTLAVTQVVRAQSPSLICPVILENFEAADLVTQAATADSVDVMIVSGEFQSAATVSAGGIALLPVTNGTVTVRTRPSGYLLISSATQTVVISSSLSAAGNIPVMTDLQGNHPNPFNPVTQIDFSLARAGQVDLAVYDIRGILVRSLINDDMAAGLHRIHWYGTDDRGQIQAAGVYLVRLQTPEEVKTHKMALVK